MATNYGGAIVIDGRVDSSKVPLRYISDAIPLDSDLACSVREAELAKRRRQ